MRAAIAARGLMHRLSREKFSSSGELCYLNTFNGALWVLVVMLAGCRRERHEAVISGGERGRYRFQEEGEEEEEARAPSFFAAARLAPRQFASTLSPVRLPRRPSSSSLLLSVWISCVVVVDRYGNDEGSAIMKAREGERENREITSECNEIKAACRLF